MGDLERRKTERLMLAIPIRVLAFGAANGDFSEDSETIQVNRAGARIALRHRVAAGDTLRVINLQNFAEADFRVVGAARLDHGPVAEWGVECLEPGRSIWGIDFPAPLEPEDSVGGALLHCTGCGKEALAVLSLVEIDILDASGYLQRQCDQCAQFTSWAYGDIHRPPKNPADAPPPPPPPKPQLGPQEGGIERRVHKRLPLKLPIRVRDHKGNQEISKTENISKGGLAVCLGMNLAVGEIVSVVCPYTAGGESFEQKAEIRRRANFTPGERWLYGLQYVR